MPFADVTDVDGGSGYDNKTDVDELGWSFRGVASEDAIFHWRFEIMCKCRIISLIPGIT